MNRGQRVAARLDSLMREGRLSEQKLADLSGAQQPTIWKLRNAKVKNPRDETIEPIATYFGMSVEEFCQPLDGTPKVRPISADKEKPAPIDVLERYKSAGPKAQLQAVRKILSISGDGVDIDKLYVAIEVVCKHKPAGGWSPKEMAELVVDIYDGLPDEPTQEQVESTFLRLVKSA